ncbi:hypothetical protein N7499_000894 [Penicillium canescens]|nr:hypothetical protein N7499_000894 [Penicillium canescens]KAJ6173722.1 hypothetical protein N7485_006534 [Penicillium canescens]
MPTAEPDAHTAETIRNTPSRRNLENSHLADGPQTNSAPKRRPRACQACRDMKIRCIPSHGRQACKACAKVSRVCVVAGPARSNQRRAPIVAELEKKIDALTASLKAQVQKERTAPAGPLVAGPVNAGMVYNSHASESGAEPDAERARVLTSSEVVDEECHDFRDGETDSGNDVIDRGLLSLEEASQIFTRFFCEINPLCPMVAFSNDTCLQNMRRSKPILLLAIIGVSSGSILPQLQPILAVELARQVAERVMFRTEKSVDLVQAMLVNAVWHLKHRETKDIGFNQYIHSAAVMAMELGLGNRPSASSVKTREDEAEMRRTWLTCYYTTQMASTILRNPPLIRFSPYIDECLKFFGDSPAAVPTDIALCTMVQWARIMEDVALVFHTDEPSQLLVEHDPRTQYHLHSFNKRLVEWKENATRSSNPNMLDHMFEIGRLFVHEIVAVRYNGTSDPNSTPPPVTATHIEALTTCVVSIGRALESFLRLDLRVYRVIDCPYMTWTLYAAIVMVRLSELLHSPLTRWGDVFLPDMKTNYYLSAIIRKLTVLSESDANPTAHGFCCAFKRLQSWHTQRSNSHSIPDLINGIKSSLGKSRSAKKQNSGTEHHAPDGTFSHGLELQTGEVLATPDTPVNSDSLFQNHSPFNLDSWNMVMEDSTGFEPFPNNVGFWLEA